MILRADALAGAGEVAKAAELQETIARRLAAEDDRPRAIAHRGLAIELRRREGNLDQLSVDYNIRGNLHRLAGDGAKAHEDFSLAFEAALRSGNRSHQASSINNLGLLQEDGGGFGEARQSFEKALDLIEDVASAWKPRFEILRNLSRVYRLEGNFDEAFQLLERAGQILQENQAEERRLAGLFSDLGFLEELRGRSRAALGFYLEALELAADLLPQDRIILCDRLGSTLASLGRPDEAGAAYRQALELVAAHELPSLALGTRTNLCKLSVLFPGPGPDSADCDREPAGSELADTNVEAGYRYWHARHLQQQGQLEGAIAEAEKAVELTDSLRSRIAGRTSRSRFLEDRAKFFRYTVDLQMTAHNLHPEADWNARALAMSERLRARTLRELWAEAGIGWLDGVDTPLRRAIEEASRELERWDAERGLAGAEARISTLLNELDSLDQRLRQSSPRHRLVLPPAPTSVADAQAKLDPNTAIVQLALGEARSFLFILEAGGLRSFELAPAAELEAVASRFLDLLADPDALPHRAALWTAGLQVNRLLFGDREERLDGLPPRLVFLGDGGLQQFPLAALPRRASHPEDPRFLIESFEIVHLPSLALLANRQSSAPTRPGRKALLIADPLYRLVPRSDIRLQALGAEEIAALFPAGAPPTQLGRLPFADLEARRIEALFGSESLDIARGPHASRKLVVSSNLSDYSLIHFTSHGWSDPQHPELSALLLTEIDAEGKTVDGRLRLQDLYRLRLGADLVVASACRTAIGGNLRLEGVGGLAQGFFHAGARRTLVSLWQIESESTAELMDLFYSHLLAGEAPGRSLQLATLDLIEKSKAEKRSWEQPYFWSSFVLIGDGSPFSLPQPQN